MAKNISKNREGYGYKYADIAQIHKYLIETDQSYYQYIETDEDGDDYIITVPIIDGEEKPPRRGCRVIQATLSNKSNPAQEQGSGITYARRYSLLMAFGLATEDDDAEIFTKSSKGKKAPAKPAASKPATGTIGLAKAKALAGLLEENGIDIEFVCKLYNVPDLASMTESQHVNAAQNVDKIKQKQEGNK